MFSINTFIHFAQSYTQQEVVTGAVAGYGVLTILVPLMIAILVILVIVMIIGIYSLLDRVKEVRFLLEDVFEDKLNALDEEERVFRASKKAETERVRLEKSSVSPHSSKIFKVLLSVASVLFFIAMIILLYVNTRP